MRACVRTWRVRAWRVVCVHIDALGVERRPDGVAEHEDELVGVVVGARGQHTVLGARLDVEQLLDVLEHHTAAAAAAAVGRAVRLGIPEHDRLVRVCVARLGCVAR